MKISTKGRYGLRILLDVALHQERGPVALSEIARRQALSQKYLWQVINPLKKAGFLRANIAFGMARADLRDGLREEMKKYLAK